MEFKLDSKPEVLPWVGRNDLEKVKIIFEDWTRGQLMMTIFDSDAKDAKIVYKGLVSSSDIKRLSKVI